MLLVLPLRLFRAILSKQAPHNSFSSSNGLHGVASLLCVFRRKRRAMTALMSRQLLYHLETRDDMAL